MSIGNKYEDETMVHCIGCRTTEKVFQVAHRVDGHLVGYIFCCETCHELLKGKLLEFKEASHEGKGG